MMALALPALLLMAALPLQEPAGVSGTPPAPGAAVDVVIEQSGGADTDGSSAAPQGSTPSAPASTPDLPLRALVAASAGSTPDTIMVGDHFRALVRVEVPAGASVEFPQFNIREPVEALGPVEVSRDSLGAWLALYRLVAWTVSDSSLAAISFRVRPATGESADFRVRLRMPVVRSVLPADTALHVPRPARSVIPLVTPGTRWPAWLVPAALLAILAATGMWLMMRRPEGGLRIAADPRTRALARLASIEREGLLERGELRRYHDRMSRVLRTYLSAAAGWGEDRTSTEILVHAREADMEEPYRIALEQLLQQADRIKFAGTDGNGTSPTEIERARGFGVALRSWVADWSPAALAAPAPAGSAFAAPAPAGPADTPADALADSPVEAP